MSALSSAGSWGGAPDIIDLDRYMRGARPPHPSHTPQPRSSSSRSPSPHTPRGRRTDGELARLVVDGGGAGLPPPPAPPAALKPTSLSSKSSTRRGKRYSHDSGLSDGSDRFDQRRHRRAVAESGSGRSRSQDERGSSGARARARRSTDSLRNFKVVYERALLEQQQQIARVAQLCERLTSSAGEGGAKGGGNPGGGGGGGGGAPARRRSRRASPDASSNDNESSDMSSSNSSHSTLDKSKKDRHRSAECKTYKIIMTKLDELNRMFLSRRAPPPAHAPPAPHAPPAAPAPPSETVSVSDKLVATDPQHQTENCVAYALTVPGYRPAMGRAPAPSVRRPGTGGRGLCCTTHTVSRLATARAHELDIAPAPAATPATPARAATPVTVKRSGFLNVFTESLVAGGGGGGGRGAGGGCSEAESSGRSAHAPHCLFDLDDPVHLYSQAKRLPGGGGGGGGAGAAGPPRAHRHPVRDVHACDSDKSNVHKSLCSLCKGYWRALTGLAAQFFYRPEES